MMGVREIGRFLEQWEMNAKDLHRRMILTPLFSALSVFLTLWESTIQKLVRSFRPLLRRAAPTDFF